MDLNEFKRSLAAKPPGDADKALEALWHEGRGDWATAHRIAQSDDSADAAWVHAYLHRREGDAANAAYWYARAGGRTPCTLPLEREWEQIVTALLKRS